MDHPGVYMHNGSIIAEMVSLPSTTGKAGTEVAITIIDAAIKAYMRPPVALVKYVNSIIKSPIAGGP
jgi:hypothetical protein